MADARDIYKELGQVMSKGAYKKHCSDKSCPHFGACNSCGDDDAIVLCPPLIGGVVAILLLTGLLTAIYIDEGFKIFCYVGIIPSVVFVIGDILFGLIRCKIIKTKSINRQYKNYLKNAK